MRQNANRKPGRLNGRILCVPLAAGIQRCACHGASSPRTRCFRVAATLSTLAWAPANQHGRRAGRDLCEDCAGSAVRVYLEPVMCAGTARARPVLSVHALAIQQAKRVGWSQHWRRQMRVGRARIHSV